MVVISYFVCLLILLSLVCFILVTNGITDWFHGNFASMLLGELCANIVDRKEMYREQVHMLVNKVKEYIFYKFSKMKLIKKYTL